MLRKVFRFLGTPFRVIPWYVWLAALAVAAWFGRTILVIIATIIAFHPIPVPPLFQGDPDSVAEARLQDLEHFNHVRRNERSMTPQMRARFDDRVAALRAQVETLSDAEFMLGLARAQAVIDNGHSNASVTRMVARFDRLPMRFADMAGEVRILRARGEAAELLGARLDAINGVPAAQALARFRDTLGGNDAFAATILPAYLDAPDFLAAVGIGAAEAPVVLDLTLVSGERAQVPLAAEPADADAPRAYPGDLPQPWVIAEDWQVVQPQGAPLYLQHADRGYWMERIAGGEIAYVSLRTNFDDDSGESLQDFAARIEAELAANPPRAILVDQRFSGGGDLTRTHALMSALPELTEGRVYHLVSANTFSAAIVNLASTEEVAPERTLLVGEPIGDRLQFWAEGWTFNLPNSGFRARYSTGFYDLQNGCEGLFRCHWGSLHIFPILVEDLDIDVAAPLTFEAFAAGRDPALEAVLAMEGVE
ncbi:hypothetical protein [Maricaulis parjimensis]|uniref:hypothetical protein n=1 Tax=Maricaulis parjimensis TaxID=144023 RepID=UPI00193AB6B5|nr:hypothetical protein [Maricaulis parjimensis]